MKCVILGYPSGTKGYRLWSTEPEPGSSKIVISRNVVFDESRMPYLTESNEKSVTETPDIATTNVKVELEHSDDASDHSSDEEQGDEQQHVDLSTGSDLEN